MLGFLSRLNRRRLFVRDENLRNKKAKRNELLLSASERSQVEKLLRKFAPKSCEHNLIRIGPELDGGYILPDDLEDLKALYSPGVSDTLGFDMRIAERGIPCFLADGTVDQPANMHSLMTFDKMMIGDGPKDTFIPLEDWVAKTSPQQGDMMLQMDIEGAEYDVLIETPSALLERFRIIVLELHWLDDYLFGAKREKLEKLMNHLQKNHIICHLHPNNVTPPVEILGQKIPPIIELTLLRKDRVGDTLVVDAAYPHPFDAVNDSDLPHRDFPPFWNA